MNISIKDFFRYSVYITVDHKRQLEFDSIFHKMFSCDGYDIPKMYWGYVNNDLNPKYKCALSHASIVKFAKTMDWPFVVIFEDDAYPRIDVEIQLKSVLNDIPNDAKMLVLGFNKYKSAKKINDSVSLLTAWCWGSHAYMIFRDGYDDYNHEYNVNSKHMADDFYGILKNVYVSNVNLFIQHSSKKSMNGYSGYVYENKSHSEPPAGFPKIETFQIQEK